MKIRVFMPWNNLGCLGLQVGDSFYTDIYRTPCFAWYMRIKDKRYTLVFSRFWRGFRRWR